MTVKNFLTFCEGFYGEKYSGIFLDVMVSYLEGRSEAFLDSSARVLVKRFSRTYGKVPGPAEIEKNLDEIYQGIPDPVYMPEYREEISDVDREEMSAALALFRKTVLSPGNSGPSAGLVLETLAPETPAVPAGAPVEELAIW